VLNPGVQVSTRSDQLAAGMRERGLGVEVLHMVELLARAYGQ
jgi:hypothetical protein